MSNQAVYLDYTNVSFAFFKLPQFLVTDSRFWEMSSDAKVLYCVMLNRLPLSIRNGWRHNGLNYIYFSMETVMELLHCSKSKALRVMKELKTFRLVEGVRCDDHRRMRYFFLSDGGFDAATGVPNEPVTASAGVISDAESKTGVISKPDRSESEPCTGVKSDVEQVSKPDRRKNDTRKTDWNKIEPNKNHPSQQDLLHQAPAGQEQGRRRSKEEMELDLRQLWERDTMYTGEEQARLDRLISTCASALSRRGQFRVNGTVVPSDAAYRRLQGLDYEAVGYALDYLNTCPKQCGSPAAYAIAVLYNAPEEAADYWLRKVEADMNGGRRWGVA